MALITPIALHQSPDRSLADVPLSTFGPQLLRINSLGVFAKTLFGKGGKAKFEALQQSPLGFLMMIDYKERQ